MQLPHLRRTGLPLVKPSTVAASQGSLPPLTQTVATSVSVATPPPSQMSLEAPTIACTAKPAGNGEVAAGVAHEAALPTAYANSIPRSDEQILRFLLAFLDSEGLGCVPIYINGGYVRDLFLGKHPDDLDLTLCLRDAPEDVTVAGLLEKVPEFATRNPHLGITEVKMATILSNESKDKNLDTFKSYFLNGEGNKTEVDVMPTIGEEKYEEGSRIPIRDQRGTAEEDALRRDLTIGAMLLLVERGDSCAEGCLAYRLFDFYGGAMDLRAGVLRAPFPSGRSAKEVAAFVLCTPQHLELAEDLQIAKRPDAEAVQILWWAKILIDDPVRACRALRFAAKFRNFVLHETFWDAMPFALQALRSKVAGGRKNTEYLKIGSYGFQACVDFMELAFTRTFGPETGPKLRLATALFGGQDDKGRAKTLSEVHDFDLETFRSIAASLQPIEGCSVEAADMMGGLLVAAIASANGLQGSFEEEFVLACEGMCVSNTMREAGFAPLHAAARWIAEPLQPNALDAGFADACGILAETMRFHVQVWQDLQLPGTTTQPAWSMPRRRLALALARRIESLSAGKHCRAESVATSMDVVANTRPAVKGSVLSMPGLLEVPPMLRRQVMSLLEVGLRILGNVTPLENREQLEDLFNNFPEIRTTLDESIFKELAPQKVAKKKDVKKK